MNGDFFSGRKVHEGTFGDIEPVGFGPEAGDVQIAHALQVFSMDVVGVMDFGMKGATAGHPRFDHTAFSGRPLTNGPVVGELARLDKNHCQTAEHETYGESEFKNFLAMPVDGVCSCLCYNF